MKALDVAKYLLSLINIENGDTISNLKLQKLLYYLQGYYLALFHKPLFEDKIEAWDYGPVVPNVYDIFKGFHGESIITDNLKFDISELTEEDRNYINKIFSIYNDYSASSLVYMTHNESPWKDVYKKYENNEITKESLETFFNDRVEEIFLKDVKDVLKEINFDNVDEWEEYKFNYDN